MPFLPYTAQSNFFQVVFSQKYDNTHDQTLHHDIWGHTGITHSYRCLRGASCIHCRSGLFICKGDVKYSWTFKRERRKLWRRNQLARLFWIRKLVSLHYFLDGLCLCLSPLHYGSETKGPPEETWFSVTPVLEETLVTAPNTQWAQWITKILFCPLWEVSQGQFSFLCFS